MPLPLSRPPFFHVSFDGRPAWLVIGFSLLSASVMPVSFDADFLPPCRATAS